MLVRLRDNPKITILSEHDVKQITIGEVVVVDKEGKENSLPADWVVIAWGLEPVSPDWSGRLAGLADEIYTIGDALQPRDIASGIYEGAIVGREI